MITFIVAIALLLDKTLGEPPKFHPLVGFGNWASFLEKHLNQSRQSKLQGVVAVIIAIAPIVLLVALIDQWFDVSSWLDFLLSCVVLYLAIGWQSLLIHAQNIRLPLIQNDESQAQYALSMIVSRDTSKLDEKAISKAATESVLENGADAIFSTIFWFLILGVPGVVLYRLSNTLDAMWGYKNDRFYWFGWCAARLDDVMNFVPARLTALSYALVGHFSLAMHCWRKQGLNWKSPNAGPVMAAGAGALNVSLGGKAVYHGETQQRPILGPEENAHTSANFHTIQCACELVNKTLLLWIVVILCVECLQWLI